MPWRPRKSIQVFSERRVFKELHLAGAENDEWCVFRMHLGVWEGECTHCGPGCAAAGIVVMLIVSSLGLNIRRVKGYLAKDSAAESFYDECSLTLSSFYRLCSIHEDLKLGID